MNKIVGRIMNKIVGRIMNKIVGSRTDIPRWRDIQGNINEKILAGTGVSIVAGTGDNDRKYIISASSTTTGDWLGTWQGYSYTDFLSSTTDYVSPDSVDILTNKTLEDAKFTTSINAQTGTAYTLVLTDSSKLITLTNDDAITLTIPTNASVAFPIGTQIDLSQMGAGKVTFAGAGVTINSKGGNKTIADKFVGVSLIKTDTNTWLLVGDLIA